MYYIRQTLHSSLEEGLGTRLHVGLPKLFLVYWLGLSIAVRVRVGVGTGNGHFIAFFPLS